MSAIAVPSFVLTLVTRFLTKLRLGKENIGDCDRTCDLVIWSRKT